MITLWHLGILDTETLQHINFIMGTIFFAFSGSYIQEVIHVYHGRQRTVKMYKVIIGTVIGGLVYLVVQNNYFSSLGIIATTIINFIFGAVGYELFSRCSSIESLKKLANDINDIIRNITGIDIVLFHYSNKRNKDKYDDDEDNHKKKQD